MNTIEPSMLVEREEEPISRPERQFAPSIEFGVCSACLGSIALMLFFLPILSIPISSCGLVAGLAGIIRGLYSGKIGMRWSMIGSALSAGVLLLGIILVNAPVGETPSRAVPRHDWSTPDHPFVSPPAMPG
ncbi:MAG TPA: hypothetical protein VHX65_04845 [Pirellulales bacterium]|jgi:dolichol kinase|nr:hypothetical protein [Pirellulales bacterium]